MMLHSKHINGYQSNFHYLIKDPLFFFISNNCSCVGNFELSLYSNRKIFPYFQLKIDKEDLWWHKLSEFLK